MRGDVIVSKNGYMESVDIREDCVRNKRVKREWFWYVNEEEICKCFEENVCMCESLKKLCVNEECDCEVMKWSRCGYVVYVLDEYEVESGKCMDRYEELRGKRGVKL